MCALAGVSRSTYYRWLKERAPAEAEAVIADAIQEIVLAHHRRYGYRRVAAELRRRGLCVNHKRVLRIMGEDDLLAIRHRKYIFTTNSRHDYPVYLNLAGRVELTGVNQVWVADITYIQLPTGRAYLAVIIDRFSRKAIGWALDRRLTATFAIRALHLAIERRQPPPGVVHHSDQGVQYACAEYVAVLEEHHMIPSMSRPANPYDNAACESFMKTLKQEAIYCRAYSDFDDLAAHVEEFIGTYYNRHRLHSALGYRTPDEFEAAHTAAGTSQPAVAVRYFVASNATDSPGSPS